MEPINDALDVFTTLRGEVIEIAIAISVSLAISAALTGLQMLLTPKPKKPVEPDLGDRGQTVSRTQPIAPWRFVYGTVRIGLHPMYRARRPAP